MRQSTKRALNYANEIRRNQRNEIIAGLRSKLLGNIQLDFRSEMQEDQPGPTNHTSQPNPAKNFSDFHNILIVLISLRKQREKQHKIGVYAYGCDLFQYILTSNDQQSFHFQYFLNESQTQIMQLSIKELKSGLLQLPKIVTKLINQININLARIKNCQKNAIRESYIIFDKIGQCAQIRKLIKALKGYLQAYLRLSQSERMLEKGRINYELLQLIADSLIQSTCFKPRMLLQHQFHSQDMRLLGGVINMEMQKIRDVISKDLCQQVILSITRFRQREEPLNLFTSFIYLIGNVLINIYTHSKQKKQIINSDYDIIHRNILKKFNNILEVVLTHLSSNTLTQLTQKQLIQLGSLMMWFIRNQFLNRRGVFIGENFVSLIDNQTASHWLHIIFNLFSVIRLIYSLKYSQAINPIINPDETNLIQEGVSLIYLIYNDCTLSDNDIQKSFEQVSSFRHMLILQAPHHEKLREKILDFYQGIACSSDNHKARLKDIATEAECVIAYGPKYPSAIKFALKLIQPKCRLLAKFKQTIFAKICSSVDDYIKVAKNDPRVQVIDAVFFMILSSVRAQQNLQMLSGKAFELLNGNRVVELLQLCGLLWDESPKDDIIIASLQMVKMLAQMEGLRELIGDLMKKKGYDRQLQDISLNTNQQVNQLVYQIMEILEIQ